MSFDTIAAIATPPGEGGLGVIRLSGPAAVSVVEGHFKARGGLPLSAQAPRLLQFGAFSDAGRIMDELLCVRFQAPHSFTGEDVVELHAHGGAFHLSELLKVLLRRCRLARPGEFTQRAFVNGKMDLTRAEAVADLIASGGELSRDAAARQLAGGLFELIEGMRARLLDLSAQAEAAVDFPDEEEQLLPRGAFLAGVRALRASMRGLLDTARSGRVMAQGLRVVLAGPPNAGKSSLMNALLKSERSIVTATAGTTRDFIEERLNLRGLGVLLTDTAGLRESADPIEREGARRSLERLASADLLILVLDASKPLEPAELTTLRGFQGERLFAANKADLKPAWGEAELAALEPSALGRTLRLSCVSGEGLDSLMEKIFEEGSSGKGAAMQQSVALTQARHEDAMRRAEAYIGQVEATLSGGRLSAEFLSGDLRGALDALGEIVGVTSREDVINAIFAKFCIGK